MFDLLNRLKTIVNPPRHEAGSHCQVCGVFVGTAGGDWNGRTLLCGSRRCAETDLGNSAW